MAEEGFNVKLYVYDLSQGMARQLSSTFLGKVIEGIWHTGVVVYGNEYFFSGGIQNTPAGKSHFGRPCKVVNLGTTQIPKEIFEDYLKEIAPRYTQQTYSLLQHNCNNFSEEVSQFLLGVSIPDYILKLPQEVMASPMGPLIMPMIQQFETTLRYGGVPQVPQPAGLGLGQTSLPIGGVSHFPAMNRNQAVGGLSQLPKVNRSQASNVSQMQPGTKSAADGTSNQTKPSDPIEPKLCSSNVESKAAGSAELKSPDIPKENGESKSAEESTENVPPAKDITAADKLGDARAIIQKEITTEFAALMAEGRLRASEAAALATRRVMEKHGRGLGLASQG